tara:strand:- start:405 stop:1178 length:774 start_codon:yes stop_codon:yes gene_type:complete
MLGLGARILKPSAGPTQYRTRTSCTFTEAGSDYIARGSASSHFRVDSKDFSVSGWIKLTADASSVSNEDGYPIFSAGAVNNGGFWIQYVDLSGDSERFALVTDTGSAQSTLLNDTDVDHDIWYHLVFTYDVSATTCKIYVNGSLDATGASVSAPAAFSGNATIGANSADAIDAIMCEIAFFQNICLTADDVEYIYNNGRPKDLTKTGSLKSYLKGYWRLNSDDATGTDNVLDYSGYDHHATTSGLTDSDFDTTDVPG